MDVDVRCIVRHSFWGGQLGYNEALQAMDACAGGGGGEDEETVSVGRLRCRIGLIDGIVIWYSAVQSGVTLGTIS